MKVSEARIILYLYTADKQKKYATLISRKLKIDYSYVNRLLNEMEGKQWIKSYPSRTKIFYSVTRKKYITEAGKRLL